MKSNDNKSKFKLVEPAPEETFILEETVNELPKEEPEVLTEEERKKKLRRKRIKIAVGVLLYALITNGFLFWFGIFWQDDTSLMAVGDALWLAFTIQFAVAWILTVYNYNIFSPLIHGTKTFLLMFIGRRPKDDYYTYMKKVQDNQISSFFIWVAYLCAAMVFIPALITLIILIN